MPAASGWCEEVANLGTRIAYLIERSCADPTQGRLELGKNHLNRIEIGRAGWRGEDPTAVLFERGGSFVRRRIVTNDTGAASG